MVRKLEKAESRQRWSELRDLWNVFDPIGVMTLEDWPRDEYENYVGGSMRLLEQNADISALEAYIEDTLDYIGLSRNKGDKSTHDFAQKMRDWFDTSWHDTVV